MMSQPRVEIVILNWNGIEDSIECIESLRQLKYQNYEITVVDNGSSDGSQEVLREKFGHVKLIENNENLGFGAGNNVGIRSALNDEQVDYVFLLNNDTVVDPELLSVLVSDAERDTTIGILGPKIYFYDQPSRIWSIGGYNLFTALLSKSAQVGLDQLDKGQYIRNKEVEFLWSCAFLVRREVFESVGLLDSEYFVTTEDFDFCYRVRQAGYKIKMVAGAKLWHKISQSTGGAGYTPKLRYFSGRGLVIFMKKHGKWWQWPVFIFTFWLSILYALIREGLRGNQKAVFSKANGFYDGLRNRNRYKPQVASSNS